MKLVREDRIEICGFNLNMPTEVVGHEELIRCLYDAQKLRDTYGVTIDTAQINDVPGYTWALADLLPEAGIHRVSFRANSIRGNFLWYREGAVPRPFYWQGPAGGRVFMWYTDTYRDGNFFREPGLHEDEFLDAIRRNEATGYAMDYIQLRMGGDNLPPELNTSKNAKAWNEKYLWPRVVVSTNREFLEPLERDYGRQCKTFRGDIPSWWADGPASAARENGIVRLLHDELVTTEGLWTLAGLHNPGAAYPRKAIDDAYNKMLHFDEHTWGASGSISEPKSENTLRQWAFKKAYADDAKRMGDELRRDAVAALVEGLVAEKSPAPTNERLVALVNPLAWERTDVVSLPLDGSPLAGAGGIRVVDTRSGKPVEVQMSADGRTAFFVAEKLPSLGYAVFAVSPGDAAAPKSLDIKPELENRFYRIEISPEAAGWTSWRDKLLDRELLDRKAKYLGNQPIHERSLDGRDAITAKNPTRFERIVPGDGKIVRRTTGPVFDELVLDTSLPTVPNIRQSIRLYHGLKMVDVENVIDKQEVFEPEGVYFAFPFDVPKPTMRVEIADASMRLGIDQLTYSCQDFYAIQHWLDAAGDGDRRDLGAVGVPARHRRRHERLSMGRQDRLFQGPRLLLGHEQLLGLQFQERAKRSNDASLPADFVCGEQDPARATRFAWQPFQPILPIWLDGKPAENERSFASVDGESVLLGCLKTAETKDCLIVRLLEMRGEPAEAVLRLNPSRGRTVARAFRANCLEVEQQPLDVADGSIRLKLKPNEIVTVGVEVK